MIWTPVFFALGMSLGLMLVALVVSAMDDRRPIEIDGDLYLERFYLCGRMPPALAKLWPTPPRPRLGWLPFTVFLHCFHRPDRDRYLHNHPWPAWGMILSGGYEEQRHTPYGVRTKVFRPGALQRLKPNTYHTVARLLAPRVWTLFITGRKVQGWGFHVPGIGHVPHRMYSDAQDLLQHYRNARKLLDAPTYARLSGSPLGRLIIQLTQDEYDGPSNRRIARTTQP